MSAPISVSFAARPTTASRTDLPRLRITRRGRSVLVSLAAVPLVVLALAVALNGGGAIATATGGSTTYDYVTVHAGQTLWQVAEAVAPQEDPREVISRIVHLNQLAGSDVEPGQRLAIPSEYAE
jgi:hypothetical protein